MPGEKIRIPEQIKSEEDIPYRMPPTKDTDSQYEQILRAKEQEHEHSKDDRITKYGFFLVAGTLGACFVLAGLSLFGVNYGTLWDDFIKIASSTITLVLGYLFGRKEK